MKNMHKKIIAVALSLVTLPAWANMAPNAALYAGAQQSTMPLNGGFVAPPMQRVQENPAYMSQGISCSNGRFDNVRIQNGNLVPAQSGGQHFITN